MAGRKFFPWRPTINQKIAHRFGSYIVMGAVVLIAATFAAWQLTRLFSPTDTRTGNGATVTLKTSDHQADCTSKVPLVNSLTSGDTPCYSDTINSGPTVVRPNNGNFDLFRIQGEVSYR